MFGQYAIYYIIYYVKSVLLVPFLYYVMPYNKIELHSAMYICLIILINKAIVNGGNQSVATLEKWTVVKWFFMHFCYELINRITTVHNV